MSQGHTARKVLNTLPVGVKTGTITFFFFGLHFRATPAAYGVSQARGRIRAVVASLHHSNNRADLCLQPTPQLTATPDP